MSDIPVFGDQAKHSISQQIRLLSQVRDSTAKSPYIVGHLNHSHTEPEDFLEFAQRGAVVLLTRSGIILHNLAARNAINRIAFRPVLLWEYGADKTQQYLLGEEMEASATGSDGIVYDSNDLLEEGAGASAGSGSHGEHEEHNDRNGNSSNSDTQDIYQQVEDAESPSSATTSNTAISTAGGGGNSGPNSINGLTIPASYANAKFKRCNSEGLSAIVKLQKIEHLYTLLNLPNKPNAIFTFDDDSLGMNVSTILINTPILHVHLYNITNETQSLLSQIQAGAGVIVEDISLLPEPSPRRPPPFPVHNPSSASSSFSSTTSASSTPPTLPSSTSSLSSPLVKVCGIKTIEAAEKALESGADMIGMILAPGRNRTVDLHEAKRISDFVHNFNRFSPPTPPPTISRRLSAFSSTSSLLQKATQHSKQQSDSTFYQGHHKHDSNQNNKELQLSPPWPTLHYQTGLSVFEFNSRTMRAKAHRRPAVVGVFQNQPLETVLALQHELSLDYVQLHGSEPLEWCRLIPAPVIKRFTPNADGFVNCSMVGYHYIALLDGEIGGEGKLIDWTATKEQVGLGARFILAGGLNENNVSKALQTEGVFGVDVSGGVETDGVKDLGKIERFVKAAKSTDAVC